MSLNNSDHNNNSSSMPNTAETNSHDAHETELEELVDRGMSREGVHHGEHLHSVENEISTSPSITRQASLIAVGSFQAGDSLQKRRRILRRTRKRIRATNDAMNDERRTQQIRRTLEEALALTNEPVEALQENIDEAE